jgi:PAS domain S-box-containing protein
MAPEIEGTQELRDRVSELEMELLRYRSEGRRSAEMTFRLLADAAPVMIWIAGPDSLCTYFNKSWLDFRGRSMEQEVGNGWAEGLHPDDRDLCLATYQKSFFARQPFRMEYRLQRADGEYRWIEATGVPRLEDETFFGFMGSAADITSRRHGAFVPDEEAARLVFSLTERERQVLVLIADGKSTRDAALRLGISYKTADSHRSRILEKLGVHETASMVRYAIRAGLIAP